MCLAHRKSSVFLQSYQSAQLVAWDYPTPVNHLSSGHGLRQHKSIFNTRIFNLWRGTAQKTQPLAWPGAWGPLPGYKSLLQGQSRQGYVHHVQYDSKPSLSWAAGAQRTVHTTHLGESSANECQQPPSFDGTHTTPPTPAHQDSRALPPPLPFQTHSCTQVPNVLMFS